MNRSRSTVPGALPLATAALAALALALAGCGDATGPLPQEGAPNTLEFSMSGYGVGSTTLELRGDTLLLWRVPWDWTSGEPVDSTRAVPTSDDWRGFWEAAERAGVRSWRRGYMAEGVADGLGWSLHLLAGGQRIRADGSNAYPDFRGREHEMEMTAGYREFLSALGGLIGEPL